MSENNGVGVNLIWAVTFLIVVGVIAGALYYSGFLSKAGGVDEKKIDVKIETPAN
ncbi:MAG: hypothetical protein HKN25_07950 [Pyrinomonadaceae bacterium]|nr:hypothetical protein [Pyrinomonadaceae bacterium]